MVVFNRYNDGYGRIQPINKTQSRGMLYHKLTKWTVFPSPQLLSPLLMYSHPSSHHDRLNQDFELQHETRECLLSRQLQLSVPFRTSTCTSHPKELAWNPRYRKRADRHEDCRIFYKNDQSKSIISLPIRSTDNNISCVKMNWPNYSFLWLITSLTA